VTGQQSFPLVAEACEILRGSRSAPHRYIGVKREPAVHRDA
jgi:hypothetical protein